MGCVTLVQGLHDWYASDAPDDLVVINVVALDGEWSRSDEETAALWEQELGLTWISVADPEGEWMLKWGGDGGRSQHAYSVLDADGMLTWKLDDGSSESADIIAAAIEETPAP